MIQMRSILDVADNSGARKIAVIKPGRILFEMEGVIETDARAAMRLAAAKLPIATRFATRFAQERAS